jgi:hypothetical protein
VPLFASGWTCRDATRKLMERDTSWCRALWSATGIAFPHPRNAPSISRTSPPMRRARTGLRILHLHQSVPRPSCELAKAGPTSGTRVAAISRREGIPGIRRGRIWAFGFFLPRHSVRGQLTGSTPVLGRRSDLGSDPARAKPRCSSGGAGCEGLDAPVGNQGEGTSCVGRAASRSRPVRGAPQLE